jgi:hypothetical protein
MGSVERRRGGRRGGLQFGSGESVGLLASDARQPTQMRIRQLEPSETLARAAVARHFSSNRCRLVGAVLSLAAFGFATL